MSIVSQIRGVERACQMGGTVCAKAWREKQHGGEIGGLGQLSVFIVAEMWSVKRKSGVEWKVLKRWSGAEQDSPLKTKGSQ